MDWHSSIPVQVAVSGFIRDGHLTRHIRRVRRIYRERRERLLDLLHDQLGGSLTAVPSFYGMHVAVVAHDGIDCEAASAALAERGIMIHSLARYFLGPATCAGFIIGFAAADSQMLEAAVGAIAHETGLRLRA